MCGKIKLLGVPLDDQQQRSEVCNYTKKEDRNQTIGLRIGATVDQNLQGDRRKSFC